MQLDHPNSTFRVTFTLWNMAGNLINCLVCQESLFAPSRIRQRKFRKKGGKMINWLHVDQINGLEWACPSWCIIDHSQPIARLPSNYFKADLSWATQSYHSWFTNVNIYYITNVDHMRIRTMKIVNAHKLVTFRLQGFKAYNWPFRIVDSDWSTRVLFEEATLRRKCCLRFSWSHVMSTSIVITYHSVILIHALFEYLDLTPPQELVTMATSCIFKFKLMSKLNSC